MRRKPEDVLEGPLLVLHEEDWPAGWTPRRVIETLEPLVVEHRRERLRDVIAERVGSVTLLLDAPHDPHNAAAVLRSCDAFGLPQMHVALRNESLLVGRRVSKGTERWVDVVLHDTPERAIATLRDHGFQLIAAHPRGELVPTDLGRVPRACLLLGHEHDGLRPELLAAADQRVRIEMRGFVESLNLSVAAALLLSAATHGRAGDLDEPERERLYARALCRSVRKSREILVARGEAR